jgi:hypothetical protein
MTVSPLEVTSLILTLVLSGYVVTSILWGMLPMTGSAWYTIFFQATLNIWLLLDNYVILLDLKKSTEALSSRQCNTNIHNVDQSNTIEKLNYTNRELTRQNSRLSQKLFHYTDHSLANVHWSLIFSKAMALYYIKHNATTLRRSQSPKIIQRVQSVEHDLKTSKLRMLTRHSASETNVLTQTDGKDRDASHHSI